MGKNLTEYVSDRASPILSKQRFRETRKNRTFWEKVFLALKVTTGVVTGIMLLLGLVWIWQALMHSPKFDVAIKEVQGLRYVSESQVLQKVGEYEMQARNLLALDIDGLRKSIERIPWVDEAVVRRILPNRLSIEIKERVPIAFAKLEQGTVLVDEKGVLLELSSETPSQFDFPVIVGLDPGYEPEVLARNRQRVVRYQALIQSLDENGAGLSKDISEVYLQDPENLSVILNDDTVLVHLGKEDFQEKFRHYLAMGKDLKQKYPLLDTVDLRYKNQIIVNSANERAIAGAKQPTPAVESVHPPAETRQVQSGSPVNKGDGKRLGKK